MVLSIIIVFTSRIVSVLDNESHSYARCQVGNVIRLLQVHVVYNNLLSILYSDILLAVTRDDRQCAVTLLIIILHNA